LPDIPAYSGPILIWTRAITFLSSQVRKAALNMTLRKPGKITISRKVFDLMILTTRSNISWGGGSPCKQVTRSRVDLKGTMRTPAEPPARPEREGTGSPEQTVSP